MFVENNPNVKGNVAEAAIALAAAKLDLLVYKPVGEHGRTDLVMEIGDRLLRVQCKWGRLAPDGRTIAVQLAGSRCTPNGYVRTPYHEGEVDVVAIYCGELDRCYLLPERLFAGKSVVHLRLDPAKNGQRSCINLAEQYEFNGAVAQLEERRHGMAEARGSSPLSSTPPPSMTIGSDEFRNRLGYYLDLVAEGQELFITRWGKRYLRMSLWQPQLGAAAAA
ncbi:MAG: hypothetical protein QOH13_659 [Thermoleophilaceae bacterium]|nr:hypothetical protein [Thermoleophilaceae bacterium]